LRITQQVAAGNVRERGPSL
jgi:hypothetical protein